MQTASLHESSLKCEKRLRISAVSYAVADEGRFVVVVVYLEVGWK